MLSVETQGHELAKLNADILSMMKLQGGPGMHESRVWVQQLCIFLGNGVGAGCTPARHLLEDSSSRSISQVRGTASPSMRMGRWVQDHHLPEWERQRCSRCEPHSHSPPTSAPPQLP